MNKPLKNLMAHIKKYIDVFPYTLNMFGTIFLIEKLPNLVAKK